MNFYVMTLFPELIRQISETSIIGRAVKAGLICIEAADIRDFTHDRHRTVDDYPYGGGKGMLMKPEPVYECYESVREKAGNARVVFLTPTGKTFSQKMAVEFSKEENLIFLCGHYEGIDQRVISEIVTDEVSLGDFVVTGGELPAMVMIDSISRQIPGVLSAGSTTYESFQNVLLENPQYTRPEVFHGVPVPPVLLSGDHQKVRRYEHEESLRRTYENRPELLEDYPLTKEDTEFLQKLKEGDSGKND